LTNGTVFKAKKMEKTAGKTFIQEAEVGSKVRGRTWEAGGG